MITGMEGFVNLQMMMIRAEYPKDFGDLMIRSPLMQLHIPQPVNPQLSSQTITGMSERLNNFRDLSFAVDPNNEEQLINLSKVSGILIAG
ncbi:tripartite motif-containing protein 77-like isoform X2 [Mustela erminea]|uniref:tripartite motif-containing protein 77-like isoform X2 n=1 Tax=Mustela erminea TaxID=36723 RepID=UPI0013874D4D|nr:tripartite motif-containing protein 77-like isoform X2 [Mustela erminea]